MTSLPRVSILIPNFNNGRKSSVSGDRNFIEELLQSLVETLADDPTEIEIIVQDDGSTDDSLATCREWATRKWSHGWRAGRPILAKFIERPHCGVLSVVANSLMRESRGEFCVRLDGDIVCLTPQWAAELVRTFETMPPSVGVIGPKQLGTDGRIHSAGDWILHPRGMHHIAQGAERYAVTRSIEVDHVMGCFYCYRRTIWEELGGYDENILRGQTIDFGMMARLRGWRAMCVPTIEFIHNHGLRVVRNTRADTNEGVRYSLDRFREKWGFDRIAPNLDDVARLYAGTPLLWNARVFGPGQPWPRPSDGPVDIRATEWSRYANDMEYRGYLDLRAKAVAELERLLGPRECMVQVNSRAGLFCHMLAKRGQRCIGVDQDAQAVALSTEIAAKETYPREAPQFVQQKHPCDLPLDDGSVDTVLLLDVLERHHNPVGLFASAHRVLKPDGVMLIVTGERRAPFENDADVLHAYRAHELKLQLEAEGLFGVVGNSTGDTAPGLIVQIARRKEAHSSRTSEAPRMALAAV